MNPLKFCALADFGIVAGSGTTITIGQNISSLPEDTLHPLGITPVFWSLYHYPSSPRHPQTCLCGLTAMEILCQSHTLCGGLCLALSAYIT